MSSLREAPKSYRVDPRRRRPLVEWVRRALTESGCRVIHESPEGIAPFRISFEQPNGERMGIVAYAFLANTRPTRNRPSDEHRFQVKYGSKDGRMHELWQDPFGLYTTLFVGINPEGGFFVGADPVLHSPTRFFISIEFKEHVVREIVRHGWWPWEREKRGAYDPVEVLVGGTTESFLRYVHFERSAVGEDQGHRQLIAEKLGGAPLSTASAPRTGFDLEAPSIERLHALSREFEMSESALLDLIARAPRLKMAVRGWVAEEHLVKSLQRVEGVSEAHRVEGQGEVDVSARFRGSRPIGIQCKNVLRQRTKGGLVRLDFQRTRPSMSNPCSRYYSPSDFDLVAACLHAVSESWTFQFALPKQLDRHKRCEGKLSNNVVLDARWTADAAEALRRAAQ